MENLLQMIFFDDFMYYFVGQDKIFQQGYVPTNFPSLDNLFGGCIRRKILLPVKRKKYLSKGNIILEHELERGPGPNASWWPGVIRYKFPLFVNLYDAQKQLQSFSELDKDFTQITKEYDSDRAWEKRRGSSRQDLETIRKTYESNINNLVEKYNPVFNYEK